MHSSVASAPETGIIYSCVYGGGSTTSSYSLSPESTSLGAVDVTLPGPARGPREKSERSSVCARPCESGGACHAPGGSAAGGISGAVPVPLADENAGDAGVWGTLWLYDDSGPVPGGEGNPRDGVSGSERDLWLFSETGEGL